MSLLGKAVDVGCPSEVNNNNNNSSYKTHNTAIASLCAGKEKMKNVRREKRNRGLHQI